MASGGRRCPLVLFGSQSGNAADVADKIWRSALMCGAKSLRDVRVRAMDTYLEETNGVSVPPFPPEEWAVIFVCSTTGQGDPPDNMMRFWKRLMRKAVPPNAFKGVQVAVFGLGDSSYPKYNFVAKKIYRRVVQLGAVSLLPLGLADDQHPLGIDGALSPWLGELLSALTAAAGETAELVAADAVPYKFSVHRLLSPAEMEAGGPVEDEEEEEEGEDPIYPAHAAAAVLVSCERVTSADHFQDTRHVVLATPPGFPAHRPGQVLMVQPENCAADVAALFALLPRSLGPRARLALSSAHPTCHPVRALGGLPPSPSMAWLARHCLDLNAVPRKSFFELLAAFSRHDDERERLAEFADPANLDELFTYCYRPRRTCLEVLQDFPETTRALTAAQLLEVMPWVRPRAFSIASSALAHPGQVHLLVAVVDYKSALLRRPRRGLCSNFLASGVTPGGRVAVWMAPGPGLRFPGDAATPAVMAGPGTGLAPFRSFLQERGCRREQAREPDLLFFGCRFERKDFYFADEWRRLEAEGRLRLVTAFSRDAPGPDGTRTYVQQRVREEGAEVWRLLSQEGAYFFVAGSARQMPDAVRSAVVTAAKEHGGLGETEAEAFVARLEREGRYQAETWS